MTRELLRKKEYYRPRRARELRRLADRLESWSWRLLVLDLFVFGFSAIRAPARFSVLVMFALSLLAAIAVRELTSPRLALPGAPSV